MASLYNTNKYVPIFTQLTLHINIKSFVWELFITLEGNKHCVITKQVSQFPNLQWEETEYHLIFFFQFHNWRPMLFQLLSKGFSFPLWQENRILLPCTDQQSTQTYLYLRYWCLNVCYYIKKISLSRWLQLAY